MSDLDAVLGFEAGVESERAAIVAWIARYGAMQPNTARRNTCVFLATAIERGDHLTTKQEG